MKVKIEAFLKDLTPGYLEARKEELVHLDELIKSKDFPSIKAKFHKLAGSGGGYGLEHISVLSKEIENHAELQEFEKIKELFLQYKDYVLKVELEF